jgi:hypothetical protein
MPLFAAPPSRSDVARDLVEQRFGEGTLTRASLLAPEGGTVPDRKGSRRLRR